MGLPTWHYMELHEKEASRNEALETKLRIIAKATEWLASVRCEVLGTDDIDVLHEIEREVDGR